MTDPRELLILHEHGFPDRRYVVEVARRTKTQIIVQQFGRERRFMASSGREVGSSDRWSYSSVYEGTPEQIATVREEAHRRRLLNRITATVWKLLTTAQLEAVADAIAADPACLEHE